MKPAATRLDAIDMLRGVTILEMLAAHFATYFPKRIELAIVYIETAMALFVLLAGFMVGWRILAFKANPASVSGDLWRRAAKILAVQTLLIFSAGVLVYAAGLADAAKGITFAHYLGQSLLLANQVPLIHILPTFLPLFILAPVILLSIGAGREGLLLVASAAIFMAGQIKPDLLSYGTPAIFPFAQFQIYFVAGCICGSRARRFGMIDADRALCYFAIALTASAATMAWVHLKFLPAGALSTHPLNLYGLIYHTPIIASVCFGTIAFLPVARKWLGVTVVTRLGRNALLAFVLHVYCALLLQALNTRVPLSMTVNVIAIIASIALMNIILKHYEAARGAAAPPSWARGTAVLFS